MSAPFMLLGRSDGFGRGSAGAVQKESRLMPKPLEQPSDRRPLIDEATHARTLVLTGHGA